MIRTAVPCLLISLSATLGAASSASVPQRTITAATVVMEFPGRFGAMQRPPVEFDHAAHTKALELEGCPTCHNNDEQGRLIPQLAAVSGIDSRDQLIDAYHGVCIDCHTRREASSQKTGPVTCGECHVKRAPAVSERAAMNWDYSLHARHVQAAADKCETCHHVYDEAAKQLRYEKGKEESCRSCHGAEDVERKLSLENASHRSCISCHLQHAAAGEKAGPTECVGCHDLEHQAAFLKLEEIPRLMRGQPDAVWVHDAAAKFPAVGFDHRGHEQNSRFCSSCHHQTLAACSTCHTLNGAAEGGGVTLAQSYHRESSPYSCVGCHRVSSEQRQCAGCHQALSTVPAERSCVVCHSGPSTEEGVLAALPEQTKPRLAALPVWSDDFPETVEINSLAADYEGSKLPHAKIVTKLDEEVRASPLAVRFHGDPATLCAGCHKVLNATVPAERSCVVCHSGPSTEEGVLAALPEQTKPRLAALPAWSDDFPETVEINSLAADYEGSKLPHAKIVTKLDEEVRASPLAVRFHGDPATLCAGCHHHSPVGSRPPACRSCHSAAADPISDQPGLKVAYHRQCLGCHIRMGIPKQGCTDCHAPKEVQP